LAALVGGSSIGGGCTFAGDCDRITPGVSVTFRVAASSHTDSNTTYPDPASADANLAAGRTRNRGPHAGSPGVDANRVCTD
jgi:hypothetical protein